MESVDLAELQCDGLAELPGVREHVAQRVLEGEQVSLEPGVAPLHERDPRALLLRREQVLVLLGTE